MVKRTLETIDGVEYALVEVKGKKVKMPNEDIKLQKNTEFHTESFRGDYIEGGALKTQCYLKYCIQIPKQKLKMAYFTELSKQAIKPIV